MTEAPGDIPQLTPHALTLYKQMLGDLNFIKRQQWATTNYAALLYVAMVWFGQRSGPIAICPLSTLAILTALVAIGLLFKFQHDLGKLRERIATVSKYCFAGKEKEIFDIKDQDEDRFTRGGLILAALISVCVVGAVLVLIALNHWVGFPQNSCG
jgi:hypothetical protein